MLMYVQLACECVRQAAQQRTTIPAACCTLLLFTMQVVKMRQGS